MSTAYLVVFLEVGTGQFKGAGIYSYPGHSLMMDWGEAMPATVIECMANSYQQAHDDVVQSCRRFAPLAWLLPHIDETFQNSGDKTP